MMDKGKPGQALTNAPAPKLAEIADRPENVRYWNTNAWVGIRYISYYPGSYLTKADALAYLSWLDAGNDGKHWKHTAALRKDTK